MPTVEAAGDAGFYELIHRVVQRCHADLLENRRVRRRIQYEMPQRIAPLEGTGATGPAVFFPVRCYDLNGGGIAFFLPEPPRFQWLIVELSCPRKKLYLLAEVAHTIPVHIFTDGSVVPEEMDNDFDAGPGEKPEPVERQILVGCRFRGRYERDLSQDASAAPAAEISPARHE